MSQLVSRRPLARQNVFSFDRKTYIHGNITFRAHLSSLQQNNFPNFFARSHSKAQKKTVIAVFCFPCLGAVSPPFLLQSKYGRIWTVNVSVRPSIAFQPQLVFMVSSLQINTQDLKIMHRKSRTLQKRLKEHTWESVKCPTRYDTLCCFLLDLISSVIQREHWRARQDNRIFTSPAWRVVKCPQCLRYLKCLCFF